MRPRFPPNMWAYSTTSLKWPVIFGSQEITDHNCLSDEPSPRHCLLIIALGVKTLAVLQCWVGARICSVSCSSGLLMCWRSGAQQQCWSCAWHSPQLMRLVMFVAWWESTATDWIYPIRQGCFYVPYIYKMHLLCRLLQNLGCVRTQLPLLHLLLI